MFPASVLLACSNSEAVCKFIFLSIRVCRIWRRKSWQCRRQWVRPSTSRAIAWGSPKAWQLRWMSLAQLDVSVSWECEKMIWHSPLPLQLLGTSHFHPMHMHLLAFMRICLKLSNILTWVGAPLCTDQSLRPKSPRAVPGKFLGIVSEDPTDSKSNRLHVDIFRVCVHSCEVYFIDSSKIIGNSPEVSNFNRLFLKLNWFICN